MLNVCLSSYFVLFFVWTVSFNSFGEKEKWSVRNFSGKIILPIFNNYTELNLLHPWLIVECPKNEYSDYFF